MSNLIITIISIVLLAVAVAMGIFYGGAAYENAQIKAYATETISIMQQIKAAVYEYQSFNPGVTNTTTITNALTATNNAYLNLSYYPTYSSWNINYGSHGNLIDWIGGAGPPPGDIGHFWSANLYLVSDAAGNDWVLWRLDMGPTSQSDRDFYAQLCYNINQDMGMIPYPTGVTTSIWNGVLLPFNNVSYYPSGSIFYPNLCMMTNNPYMGFAIQI